MSSSSRLCYLCVPSLCWLELCLKTNRLIRGINVTAIMGFAAISCGKKHASLSDKIMVDAPAQTLMSFCLTFTANCQLLHEVHNLLAGSAQFNNS